MSQVWGGKLVVGLIGLVLRLSSTVLWSTLAT